MAVKGRGEIVKLAEEVLLLELTPAQESFLLEVANWLSASDEQEFVDSYRQHHGLEDEDDG